MKKYVFLIVVWLFIISVFIEILRSFNIEIKSIFVEALLMAIVFFPILIFLNHNSKHSNVERTRKLCKTLFWFIVFCYILGFLCEIIALI